MVILSTLDHKMKPCADGEIKETCNECAHPQMSYRGFGGVMLSSKPDLDQCFFIYCVSLILLAYYEVCCSKLIFDMLNICRK